MTARRSWSRTGGERTGAAASSADQNVTSAQDFRAPTNTRVRIPTAAVGITHSHH